MSKVKTNKRSQRILMLAILLSGLFAIGATNAFAANVHVFNFSGEAIQSISINNQPASGPINGWGLTYQPKGIIVTRSQRAPVDLSVAAFSQNGSNHVSGVWEGSGQRFQFSVEIGHHDPRMNEDFLLFISPSQAILFDNYGSVLETFKL